MACKKYGRVLEYSHKHSSEGIMKSVKVSFPTIDSVKDFVNAVSRYPYEVDLHNGRYVVDAKSLLGIYSLDLTKPIVCEIYNDSCDELIKDIANFVVK